MIDKDTGAIQIGDVLIAPTLTRTALKLLEAFGDWAAGVGDGVAHFSYQRKIVDGDGQKLLITLYFNQEALEMVQLFAYLPDEKESGSWADWSEQAEQQRKTVHDGLLRRELGEPPYQFAWGKLWSVYDERSGMSVIIVRYS